MACLRSGPKTITLQVNACGLHRERFFDGRVPSGLDTIDMTLNLRTLSAVLLFCLPFSVPAAAAQTPGDDPYADLRIEEASPSGSYLAGRYASRQRETDIAARYIARALESDPNNPLLIERGGQ
jgi:hypothetical protein